MASDDPLDATKSELKRIEVTKSNSKEPLGLHVDEKTPGLLIIRQVKEGSPAAKAGLKIGDYPLAFGGRPIGRKAEFTAEINKVETSAVIVVSRRRSTPLDLATLKLPNAAERKPDCEYSVRRLRKTNVMEMGMDVAMKDGLATVESAPIGGAAHKAGIKAGDRILCVGEEAIRDAEHCKDLLATTSGTPVDLLIERPPAPPAAASKADKEQPKSGQPPAPPAPEPPRPASLSTSLNFQSVKTEILGIPEDGVEPPPDDVQTLMDKCRDEIVSRIKVNPDEPIKRADSKSADKKVYVLPDISMKPLKKTDQPKK